LFINVNALPIFDLVGGRPLQAWNTCG